MVVKHCFIPSCDNTSENCDKIFVTVPINKCRRSAWFAVIPDKEFRRSATTKLYCCEDHFDLEKDASNWMFYKTVPTSCLILHEDVVPHKYLNQQKVGGSQLTSSARKRRLEFEKQFPSRRRISFDEVPSTSRQEHIELLQLEIIPVELVEIEDVTTINDKNKNENEEVRKTLKVRSRKDKLVNRNISEENDLNHDIITDSAVSSESETDNSSLIPSEDETTTRAILLSTHINILESNSNFYLGIPQKALGVLKLLESKSKIKYIDILMILKKIRTDDDFERLGADFCRPTTYCFQTFKENLPHMAEYIKPFICNPCQDSLRGYSPTPFILRYPNIQSVIDCFEIQIQKPPHPPEEDLKWSQENCYDTIKYLISCTPNGFINFISCGFEGSTSHKAIVEESGFLDFLPENCDVLVDKCFEEIGELLLHKNCQLVFPTDEAITKNIPTEIVFRKLREFSMLRPHVDLNHNLVQHLDDAMVIAAGLANLQDMLIKE